MTYNTTRDALTREYTPTTLRGTLEDPALEAAEEIFWFEPNAIDGDAGRLWSISDIDEDAPVITIDGGRRVELTYETPIWWR